MFSTNVFLGIAGEKRFAGSARRRAEGPPPPGNCRVFNFVQYADGKRVRMRFAFAVRRW